MFGDMDTLSILRNKRETQAQQYQKDRGRNQIFEEKRMATLEKQINKQQLSIVNIEQILGMMDNQLEEALEYIIYTIEEAENQNEIVQLIFLWGIMEKMMKIISESEKYNEIVLVSVTYIISFMLIEQQAGVYFNNLRGTQWIEYLLLHQRNAIILEYSILCLGNIDGYKQTPYLDDYVLPRLFEYLLKLNPLPTKCLEALSWMIDRIGHSNSQQLQLKLMQTNDLDIIFEASQHCDECMNLDSIQLEQIGNHIDIQDYLKTSQILQFIHKNMTKSNINQQIINIIEKCLQSGKVLILKNAFLLAKQYIILSNQPYFSDIICEKIISSLNQSLLHPEIMSYLETLLLIKQIQFPQQFFIKYLDTLTSHHLRIMPLLLIYYGVDFKRLLKLNHKQLLLKMGSEKAQEMIQQLF